MRIPLLNFFLKFWIDQFSLNVYISISNRWHGSKSEKENTVRDTWYSDNRDLVKWSVLFRLAERFGACLILQIAYFRPSTFGSVIIDGQEVTVPPEVLQHCRSIQNVKKIKSNVRILIFDDLIKDRAIYLNGAISFIKSHRNEPRIVFLDPDIGLEPTRTRSSLGHVLESEALAFWDAHWSKRDTRQERWLFPIAQRALYHKE